jgi:hypothetical protein
LALQLCASCVTWRFLQQWVLQLCTLGGSWDYNCCGSRGCNFAQQAAVRAATLHYLRQLALQLCASCVTWLFLQQWVLQLCALGGSWGFNCCGSWGCNFAQQAAVGAATLHYMQQLALQLSLLAAVGTATLRFMQQLTLQLCSSRGSWHCNSVLNAAVGAATLCYMWQFVVETLQFL